MRKILYLFKIIVGLASDLSQVVGYIFSFLSALFCSRVTLATRVLAAESQLAACKRRTEKKDRPRPRFTQAFRLLSTTKPKVVDGPFKLLSFPICGGLHHRYERVAA